MDLVFSLTFFFLQGLLPYHLQAVRYTPLRGSLMKMIAKERQDYGVMEDDINGSSHSPLSIIPHALTVDIEEKSSSNNSSYDKALVLVSNIFIHPWQLDIESTRQGVVRALLLKIKRTRNLNQSRKDIVPRNTRLLFWRVLRQFLASTAGGLGIIVSFFFVYPCLSSLRLPVPLFFHHTCSLLILCTVTV